MSETLAGKLATYFGITVR